MKIRLTILFCIFATTALLALELEFQPPPNQGLGSKTGYYTPDWNWSLDRLDFDGDGVLELVTFALDTFHFYRGDTHALLWDFNASAYSGISFIGFYDLDGDGEKEAIFHDDGLGNIYGWDTNGWDLEFSLEDGYYFTSILDIDHDGFPELLVEYIYQGQVQIWGQSPGVAVPQSSDTLPAAKIIGAYPNPFNPGTNIRFEIETEVQPILHIIDASGRLVRNLSSRTLAGPGLQDVYWDGLDEAANPVVSGMYFVELIAGDQHDSQKISLIK